MAPYAPYSGTMNALNSLGGSLERLSAIDANRRNAVMEHEINMKRLSIGRETAEAQNRLGLLTTERGIENQRAENEYRMAELGQRQRLTDKQIEALDLQKQRQDAAEEERKWMNEAGNFETLYRGSLARQGLKPEQIDDTIANFAKLGGGLGAQMLVTPTIRAKMYDVLGDMPRMLQAERAAARLSGQSTSTADKLHDALVKEYQGKAAWLTQHGIGADTAMARSVLQAAERDGVDLTFETKDELVEVLNTDPDTKTQNPTVKILQKKPVWMANDYDANVLVSRELGNTYNKLYEKNPWLANVSQEEAADLAGKVLMNPAAKNKYLQEIIMSKPELSGNLFNATKPTERRSSAPPTTKVMQPLGGRTSSASTTEDAARARRIAIEGPESDTPFQDMLVDPMNYASGAIAVTAPRMLGRLVATGARTLAPRVAADRITTPFVTQSIPGVARVTNPAMSRLRSVQRGIYPPDQTWYIPNKIRPEIPEFMPYGEGSYLAPIGY